MNKENGRLTPRSIAQPPRFALRLSVIWIT